MQQVARPYTYTCMGADLQMMLKRVQPHDTRYGITGYRVGGYNLSKAMNGTDLTVAHGLWQSRAHNRYERFKLATVCGITANMLEEANPYESAAAPAVRCVRFIFHYGQIQGILVSYGGQALT